MGDRDLAAFMAKYPPHHQFEESWPVQGRMAAMIGLAKEPPPESVSSSILAIVFNSRGEVMRLWPDHPMGNISRFLIGGRPEAGETPEEAVVREVAEEAGWLIAPVGLVGYRHFHQHEPVRAESDRQHPDFVQQIWAATAVEEQANRVIEQDRLPYMWIGLQAAIDGTEYHHRPLLYASADMVQQSRARAAPED